MRWHMSCISFGQTFEWVRSYDSTNYDRIWDAEVHGNQIATVGRFNGTLSFNPSNTLPSVTHIGLDDILLNIYNTSGQVIVTKAIGGIGTDRSRSVAIDN